MPPAPNTFLKICATDKTAVPDAKDRFNFLSDAGVAVAPGTPAREVNERCAALVWARASLARKDDPATWLTTLPAAVHPTLLSLYVLPPWRGPAAAPADVVRLASAIAFYSPDGPQPAPQPPPGDASGNGGIDIARSSAPGDGDGDASAGAPSQASTAFSGPSPADGTINAPPHAMKRLLHDDLAALLPPSVYHALDSTSGMSPEKRAKFQDSCRKSSLATVLDWTTSPPFGHQAILALAKGSHFDPVKRGLAFALAGRSACSDTSTASLTDTMTCDAHLRLLRGQWADMLPAFQAGAELSSTHVNTLWGGATFVMTLRAARSATWGVPEVMSGCRTQLEALPTYRASIAEVLARVASAYSASEAARSINRAYLQFFLPFWWEHILERGILDADKLEKTVDSLLRPTLLPALPPPPPQPLVLPPAPAPPPAFFPTPPWPIPVQHPPHPHPGPPAWLPGGPHPGVLPPTPLPAPGHTPPAATPPAPGRTGFLGKPVSALICGKNFGVTIPGTFRLCSCPISRAFTGHTHYPFECPFRYHAQRGGCPGWTAAGTRIPASWVGDDITPACQAEWRTLAGSLPSARIAGSTEVNF